MSVSDNCAGEEVREQGEHREQPRDTDQLESQDTASRVGDLLWSREGTAGAEATEMLLRQIGGPGQWRMVTRWPKR